MHLRTELVLALFKYTHFFLLYCEEVNFWLALLLPGLQLLPLTCLLQGLVRVPDQELVLHHDHDLCHVVDGLGLVLQLAESVEGVLLVLGTLLHLAEHLFALGMPWFLEDDVLIRVLLHAELGDDVVFLFDQCDPPFLTFVDELLFGLTLVTLTLGDALVDVVEVSAAVQEVFGVCGDELFHEFHQQEEV